MARTGRTSIYPSSNDRRAGKEGLAIAVRVIRYRHDDPGRDGCGQENCLITTLLNPTDLSAQEAIELYPWRWEQESALEEIEKEVLLGGNQPLLRSKLPELVEQELYGLLLAHWVVRKVMAAAVVQAEVEPSRLSFKRSQEILEDYLMEKPGRGRRPGRAILAETAGGGGEPTATGREGAAKQPSGEEGNAEQVAGEERRPNKTDKGRVHERPFAEVCRVLVPEAADTGQVKEAAPAGHATG
jgi:hypothetical protein